MVVSDSKETEGSADTEWTVAKKVGVPFLAEVDGEAKFKAGGTRTTSHEREVTHTLRLKLKPKRRGQTGPIAVEKQVSGPPKMNG